MMLRLADDRGSTIPLILGIFLIAMLMVAGGVAAGDAFIKQRNLQSICDGAAAAAASSAVDTDRSDTPVAGHELVFADVQAAVETYLGRDGELTGVHVRADVSPDRRALVLACTRTATIALGWVFGRRQVTEHVTSSAEAPVHVG